MLQLVYVSTSTHPVDQALVTDICEQARRNNRRDEISGILVSAGDKFLQALEGPQATVEDTFLRIIVDKRHHSLTLLGRRAIANRDFGDWDMQYCEHVGACRHAIDKVNHLTQHTPDHVRRAFRAFLANGR